MLLETDMRTGADLAVLRCHGRLVLGDGAAVLREAGRRVLRAGHAVALDLGPVTQMDAHGAGVIADLCAAARDAGLPLLLAGANDRVRRLLRVTHLDTVIASASAVHPDAMAAASLRIA